MPEFVETTWPAAQGPGQRWQHGGQHRQRRTPPRRGRGVARTAALHARRPGRPWRSTNAPRARPRADSAAPCTWNQPRGLYRAGPAGSLSPRAPPRALAPPPQRHHASPRSARGLMGRCPWRQGATEVGRDRHVLMGVRSPMWRSCRPQLRHSRPPGPRNKICAKPEIIRRCYACQANARPVFKCATRRGAWGERSR